MNDLDHFEQWAKLKGHYQAVEAIARYRAYLSNLKEHTEQALRERTEGE